MSRSISLRQQTFQTRCSNALSRHRSFVTVSGASPHRYVRQPTLAFPSCRCRSASLPPTIARTPYQSHVPPTHRGCSRLHSKPPALTPPRAPMNARQSSPTLRQECDHSTYSEQPAAHGTEGSAHSLSASPRQRACRSTSYTTPLCAVCSECAPFLRPPRLRSGGLARPPIATLDPSL